MEKMNTFNAMDSGSQQAKPDRKWTPADDEAWDRETSATAEMLASEEINDKHYAPCVPLLKAEFKSLFSFEPKVTNALINDLHDFLERHTMLKGNPDGKDYAELAEASREKIRSWVVRSYAAHYYEPSPGDENGKRIDERIKRELTDEKLNNLYAWIFQNISLKN